MFSLLLIVQYSMNYISRYFLQLLLHTLVPKLVYFSLCTHLCLVMVFLVVRSLAFEHICPTMIHSPWVLHPLLFSTMAYLPRYLGLFLSWVDNNDHHSVRPFFHTLGIRL